MPTINDDFGVWNQLGTVEPNPYEWKKFPFTATDVNPSLRISYIFIPENRKTDDYGWLRCRYKAGNSELTSLAIKIFPSKDTKILEFPIPVDLLKRNIFFRDFEIKSVAKSVPYTAQISSYAETWQVKLEELWG